MKKLWIYLDKKNWMAKNKYRMAFTIIGFLSGLAGFLLWMLLSTHVLSSIDWMICFIGYPIAISPVFVFVYGCNHEFHSGSFEAS